jgi:hypothetical protein
VNERFGGDLVSWAIGTDAMSWAATTAVADDMQALSAIFAGTLFSWGFFPT